MVAPPQAHDDQQWSRTPGWVDRVVGDNVLVKGRQGEDRTVGGIAAAVWIVLDDPGTRAEILDRIRGTWPGSPVEEGTIEEALALLETNSLIQHDIRSERHRDLSAPG